ncbi:hypothetical protein [Actinomyces sp.]
MAHANDEHKSADEAEENTSTHRPLREKLKFWKLCKQEGDEPARLTPMPTCLMKWWIPILLALILLAAGCFLASIWRMPLEPFSWGSINPFWPPSWPFNYHWPSKDAMALCATIAGAGFAFSAWQQRSHDNVVKEKQAQATVEREDYWKRREHIFQLLGSKNPGLRLGAVALLAELADSAAHSTLLNKTEQQQLQRHIIDTLCLQIRHEGLEQKEEGNRDEHREIQKSIIDTLLRRINKHTNTDQQADWSQSTIRITSSHIHTTVKIDAITTDATLDFSETHFHETFTIENSSIKYIRWQSAKFHQQLLVGDNTNTVQIQIDNIPQNSRYTLFNNTCFTSNSGLILFAVLPKQATQPKTLMRNCSFFQKTCLCPPNCPCRRNSSSERCQCLARNHCKCSTKCVNAEVSIWDIRLANDASRNKVNIIFDNCRFEKFSIKLSHAHTSTTIYQSYFSHGLFIELEDNMEENTKIAYPDHPTKLLSIELCAFILPITEPCISLKVLTRETISIPVDFLNNSILAPYTYDQSIQDIFFDSYPNSVIPGGKIPLVCKRDTENPELLYFEHTLSTDDHEICSPWTTGRMQSTLQD